MLRFYCLPGKLIANLQYLFPGHRRNTISATARRKDSQLAHFLLATPFWVIAFVLLLGLIGGLVAVFGKEIAPSRPHEVGVIFSAASNPAQPVDPLKTEESLTAIEALAPSEGKAAVQSTPEIVEPADSRAYAVARPATSASSIEDAVSKAFASGEPVRWSADGRHGYAVPSSASPNGCRNVQVAPDGEQIQPAIKVCG